ncbi:hypothetical protein [Micromonospora fulviviridis]|uniref:Uncharacterized protein n=1 Tax=Micromonospora fulviviridis TaxID=47860 RepID=A0ABV2VF42_9ACTN
MNRWRLIDVEKARGRRGGIGGRHANDEHIGGASRRTHPGGVPIDGTVWPLEGEPPRAVSQGWGDLSWARRGYR